MKTLIRTLKTIDTLKFDIYYKENEFTLFEIVECISKHIYDNTKSLSYDDYHEIRSFLFKNINPSIDLDYKFIIEFDDVDVVVWISLYNKEEKCKDNGKNRYYTCELDIGIKNPGSSNVEKAEEEITKEESEDSESAFPNLPLTHEPEFAREAHDNENMIKIDSIPLPYNKLDGIERICKFLRNMLMDPNIITNGSYNLIDPMGIVNEAIKKFGKELEEHLPDLESRLISENYISEYNFKFDFEISSVRSNKVLVKISNYKLLPIKTPEPICEFFLIKVEEGE